MVDDSVAIYRLLQCTECLLVECICGILSDSFAATRSHSHTHSHTHGLLHTRSTIFCSLTHVFSLHSIIVNIVIL